MFRATAITFALLLNFCAAAEQPAANPELAQVDTLITQLGANEMSVREGADFALRKIGLDAVPKMKAALAHTTDAEIQTRLNNLLKLYPPERTNRDLAAISALKPAEFAKSLFHEYQAERSRLYGKARSIRMTGCLGPAPSNLETISYEFMLLLESTHVLGPDQALDALAKDDQASGEKSDGASLNLFARSVVTEGPSIMRKHGERELADSITALLSPSEDVMNSEQPPDGEQWKKLRGSIRRIHDLAAIHSSRTKPYALRLRWNKVSYVFNNVSVLDVIATIAIQADIRIFLEPRELHDEIANRTVTHAAENAEPEELLHHHLDALQLKFRIEGEGQSERLIIYRADTKASNK